MDEESQIQKLELAACTRGQNWDIVMRPMSAGNHDRDSPSEIYRFVGTTTNANMTKRPQDYFLGRDLWLGTATDYLP